MNKPVGQSIEDQVKICIESAIPQSQAQVSSNGNHFQITVISPVFKGMGLLDKQRMVYSAITSFISGPKAPIHAVDRLLTLSSGK